MVAAIAQTFRRVSEKYLFIFFWILAGLIYLPSYRAGFFFDFHSMLEYYHQQSFPDFINRKGIGHESLYQVTQLILFCLLSVFKTNPVPWFVLFTGLHAVNGFLVCRLFTRYFKLLNISAAQSIAFTGALIFIISPLQSEVVIWKAALHYLTGLMMILLILQWCLSYLETQNRKFIWRVILLYFISTFTLEIFYLTPAFVFILAASLKLSGRISFEAIKKCLLSIFLPLVGIWLLYLFIYYFSYGKWIAHYDFDVQKAFTLKQVITKIDKYFLHVYFMEYFWKNDWRTKAYDLMHEMPVILATGLLILGIISIGIFRFKNLKPFAKAVVVLFFLSLVSFVVILPMWFNDMQLMRNDRYYYVASVFMFMLLSVLLFKVQTKWLRNSLIGIYVLLCITGTIMIGFKARQAAKIFHGMIHHFNWHHAPKVLLLNLPNNYEGIGIIPATDPDVFNSHLYLFGRDSVKGKVFSVSSYNVQLPWDGAHITVADSLNLKVTLNQWGSWWWFGSFGATDYENDLYEVKITDPGHEYHLRFHQKPDTSTVILFQQGDQWRRVDMNKIGEEQW